MLTSSPTPLLEGALLGAATLLLVSMLLGLLRALHGPSLEDRMLAVLLLGSSGVAFLLLLALLLGLPALFDVALLLALLAAVTAIAMTRREVDDA